MNAKAKVTLYHAPSTRSTGALLLLEELGVPYDLQLINMKANEQRSAKYLAINSMGKVPAVVHNGALIDRAQKHAATPQSMSPYGDYDTMLKTLTDQLRQGPYLLGSKFTAADVLWGTALTWTTLFKLVPELPVIQSYIARVNERPAMIRGRAKDAELKATLG